jgi:hypothetical protein
MIKIPPRENPIFWKNIKVEFLAQEDAPKFLLPEYVWIFEKGTDLNRFTERRFRPNYQDF